MNKRNQKKERKEKNFLKEKTKKKKKLCGNLSYALHPALNWPRSYISRRVTRISDEDTWYRSVSNAGSKISLVFTYHIYIPSPLASLVLQSPLSSTVATDLSVLSSHLLFHISRSGYFPHQHGNSTP
jgi:hypothetical protein